MKPASFAAILALSLFFAPAAIAQNVEERTPFTLTVTPVNPAPLSTITVTPVSGAIDLATAIMTVTVNGKQIYEGNSQPITTTVGKGGSSTVVKVTMRAGIRNVSQTITVVPQDISLIMEPVSSVPPLYPGKTSIPTSGNVRFVALANFRTAAGKAIDPSTLSYSWSVDGTTASGSGIGKNSFIVATPLQYRSRAVTVSVQTTDGALKGSATLSFSSGEPYVRLYENDPLLGIRFERALSGSYDASESEASLYASPFGFSLANGAPAVQWFMNGSSVQTGNLITLRPADGGKGSAGISVVASTGDDVKANSRLTISFGNISGFNLFSL